MAASSCFPTCFLSLSAISLFLIQALANDNASLAPPFSPIAFPIFHTTEFMLKQFKDYESLVSARLAHDEVRYKLPVRGFNSTMLDGKSRIPEYIRVPLFGRPSGVHVVQLRIGIQQQIAHLLLDTGSSVIWWQCRPCVQCYEQNDPLYDPQASSSFWPIDCHSVICDFDDQDFIVGCEHGTLEECVFSIIYAEGDETKGILAFERVSNQDGRLSQNVVFGCANHSFGTISSFYAGILGFGQNPYSFPSQISSTKFSFCLVSYDPNDDKYDPNGSAPLYLHDILPLDDDHNAFVVPLLQNNHLLGHYFMGFTGISIDGVMVPISGR